MMQVPNTVQGLGRSNRRKNHLVLDFVTNKKIAPIAVVVTCAGQGRMFIEVKQ